MNGEIAQVIALVTHGNAYLSGPPDAATPPLEAAFTFVASQGGEVGDIGGVE